MRAQNPVLILALSRGERTEGPSGVVMPISESASIGSVASATAFADTVVRFTDPSCAGAGVAAES